MSDQPDKKKVWMKKDPKKWPTRPGTQRRDNVGGYGAAPIDTSPDADWMPRLERPTKSPTHPIDSQYGDPTTRDND